MSGVVARIEGVVRDRLVARWPELRTVVVEARPLLDISLGDFGLDCCLAVGAALKLRPENLAEDLAGDLVGESEFSFTAVDGFINVSLRDPVALLREPSPAFVPPPLRLVVQPPTPGTSPDVVARLLASALVQGVLAGRHGGRFELFVGGAPCRGGGIGEVVGEARRHLAERSPAEARREIEAVLRAPFSGVTTVWIGPSFLQKGDFRDFFREFFGPASGRLLRCPPRVWCEGFTDPWLERLIGESSVEGVALMLASSRFPAELDEFALRLSEQGNLRWFLATTVERLRRLEEGLTTAVGGERELSPEARRVAIRGGSARFFEIEAILRGEVTAWSDALTDLLRSITRWINHPERRREIAEGRLPALEGKILSGATETVSDIMKGNPLF
ncbi:MAG: hypothetical protein RL417_2239 [Pseudomonadota bacterium]